VCCERGSRRSASWVDATAAGHWSRWTTRALFVVQSTVSRIVVNRDKRNPTAELQKLSPTALRIGLSTALSLWCFSTLARGSAAVVERLRDALSIKNLADHSLVLGFTTDYNDGFYNSHPTTMTFSCCINVWEITNVCKRLRPFCILEISFSNKWRNCPQEENQWVSANPGSLGKQPLNGGGGCWG